MKLICFTSTQGGVGRSQLISSIAYLLSTLDRRVGVIDLNSKKIIELLKPEVLEQRISINTADKYVLSTLIEQWKENRIEYILVNTPISGYVEENADCILIVTTPLRLALIKNMSVKREIRERNINAEIGVILNKVGECKECEYSKIIVEKLLEAPVIHQIPYDKLFIKSEQLGGPVPKLFGNTRVVISLLKLVSRLFEISIPIQKREKTVIPRFIPKFWKK